MEKPAVIEKIIEAMEAQLKTVQSAAEAAHSGATHEDAIQKGKYETHGLEMSYLAGSHYERAQRLALEIETLRLTPMIQFDKEAEVTQGALIGLESDGIKSIIYLSLIGAGTVVEDIKVLSPKAPLGQELLGCTLGDEVGLKGQARYVIISID